MLLVLPRVLSGMTSSQILCMEMITVDAYHTHEIDRVAAQVLRAIGVTSGLAGPRGF